MADASAPPGSTLHLLSQRAADLSAQLQARLMPVRAGRPTDRHLQLALDLPVLAGDPGQPALAALQDRLDARRLAQDWAGLHGLLAEWDRARAALPDGRRKTAAALCLLLDDARVPAGSFVARAESAPDDPIAAALAAEALLRGQPGPGHIALAAARLAGLEPAAHGSPLLAAAQYHLHLARGAGINRLCDSFDDWVDLDPSDLAPWREHGRPLLARAGAGEVAVAAARCEWQTGRWLGRGGYALFLLPVLGADPALWDRIDPDHLAAALLDLGRRWHHDQPAINRLAAALDRLGAKAPPDQQPLLRRTYRQLLETSLNTLVPDAWDLPEPAARRRLADAFLAELATGARFGATSAGLARRPPLA